jgi:N-methylhydantoinase A
MGYRIGIDTGGTFTDFVLMRDDGTSRLVKTPSIPTDPPRAIRTGLLQIADQVGVDLTGLLANCDLIIHGTTVALNTLIQHRGARVGLLCTKGHEDSLEIRLAHKEDGHRYDFQFPPAKMLVPRFLRVPIEERVTSAGKVLTHLKESDVVEAIDKFKAQDVESVAICFLWSFLNPVHERRAAAIVAERFPEAYLTVSSDLLPQIREYTRVSTIATNAYVGPVLRRSIAEIEDMLRGLGYARPIRYMQSNGGVASGETISRKAVYAINSGPAAGPTGGLFYGRLADRRSLLTLDMGGTSTDISIMENGEVDIVKNIDVSRYRLGIPLVNVVSIGAGGGSIAWLDSKGILRVGPQSAEAVPGPACYRRGGTEATVTDALVVLGYLNPDYLLGGDFRIDRAAAESVIRDKVAIPLGLSLEKAALGVFSVVNANMVGGIRAVSVERGYDPRDFVLVVGGGATSAHVARLAGDLEIREVIIPKLASGLCAFGEAIANVKHNYLATYTTPFARLDLSVLNEILNRLELEGRAALREEGLDTKDVAVSRALEMRYSDQVHECTVAVPETGPLTEQSIDRIKELFHRRHEQLYTYCERDNEPELVNVEVTVMGRTRAGESVPATMHQSAPRPGEARRSMRRAYFEELGGATDVAVYDGRHVAPEDELAGPTIIEETTTTIVVPPGWSIALKGGGFYLMTRRA